MTVESTNEASESKRAAALASLVAATAITLLKLVTGVLTGSLGMFSEAAHSGIDLVASGVTLLAVRASDRPADDDHNYGHGKVENLSAAFEILLMLGSCGWIAYEAVSRLRHPDHLHLAFSPWPFVVLGCSIAVDLTRSRALHKAAKEHQSEALEADAIHFGTDIWSASAVMLGLACSYIGQRFGIAALDFADPIAALIVAGIILFVTLRLARITIDSLTDATPLEVRQQRHRDIVRELERITDVLSVERLRVRRSGPKYFVDMTLGLPRNLTFQRAEQVTLAARYAVQQFLPDADVVVSTLAAVASSESVFDRVRAVAARANLSIHDVTVQQIDGSLHVEQHLEVPETMTLREAHDVASRLEADIRHDVPEVRSLLTHIESEPSTIDEAASGPPAAALERNFLKVAREFRDIIDVHEIRVTRSHGGAAHGLQISCHCTLPDGMAMDRVHAVITDLEAAFRHDHPDVTRVFIHPEPATDNCHEEPVAISLSADPR
ncbi:cation-efflux pump [Granulicella cerasi]|uniref:Cation-efflux pump n=1 Tax=Granulicella cerasi TaxID=741063 RepID=A0ABW1Z6Z3_9BACT|nr:cation-efflux pump [Granulicella cerasi]